VHIAAGKYKTAELIEMLFGWDHSDRQFPVFSYGSRKSKSRSSY